MRPVSYALTPALVEGAKPGAKAFALTDGGGLLLDILPGGSRVWRYKYHLNGKREKVTLGAYPAIGINAARQKHRELREVVARGESPARAKQAVSAARKLADSRAMSFRKFAAHWVDATLFYRSAGYRAQIARWLDAYINPAIGDMQLGDIQSADVLAIVEKRSDTAVTAERLRTLIQQVFNYAIRKGLVAANPARVLRGAIARPPVQSHRHLNEMELADFWRALDRQGAHATTIIATKLLFLTMARKTELLGSTWPEFDLTLGRWDIPAGRMKLGKAHRVYLSHQAVELLLMVQQRTGHGEYVFPSIFRGGVPMGEVTLNHFFARIVFGVSGFSPHGTRGTGATLLREHGFASDVVELLLAHGETAAAAIGTPEQAVLQRRALQFLADRIDTLAEHRTDRGQSR